MEVPICIQDIKGRLKKRRVPLPWNPIYQELRKILKAQKKRKNKS